MPKFLLPFLIAVSIFGLAIVPLLLIQPNLPVDISPFRQPLVSALYTVVCIMGIVAVFYPGKCRMAFQKSNVSKNSNKQFSSLMHIEGHHPDCEKFSDNRIIIGGSAFCAACAGLLIGAIAAIIVIVLFSIGFFNLETGGLWILADGEVLMLLGLTQIKMGGYAKIVVNALFVVGSCISLVVADLVGQSLLVDGYVLALIVFMLWLRILLSEWKNKQTCMACGRCV